MSAQFLSSCLLRLLIVPVMCCVMLRAEAAGGSFMDGYTVRAYTMDDGMVSNHIDDLYKDSHGFLWIAYSGGGVSRFDGHNFVNYSDTDSEHPIRSSFVRSVVEDRLGRLWVAGESGVDLIDLPTLRPVKPVLCEGVEAAFLDRNVTNISIDTSGVLWISGEQAIHRVALGPDGAIESVGTLPVPGSYHQGIVARDVDADGAVWIGMGNSIRKLVCGQDGKIVARQVSARLDNLAEVHYVSDFEVREGEVWISTDHGLYRYDRPTDSVKLYLHTDDPNSLSQNFLTDIIVTGDKQLVATSLKGLNVYNPITDDFERTDAGTHRLNNMFVNMAMVDGDKVFIATEGGGINVLTPRRLKVNTYVHSDSDPGSISNNPVNAILESPDGTLWVGTVEGGLNVRRPGERSFSHVTSDRGVLSHNSVSSLALDDRGCLWVGTWGGGIDILDAAHPWNVLARLSTATVDEYDLSYIGALIYDDVNGGMWIGSNSGLLFYDMDSGRLSPGIDMNGEQVIFGFIGAVIDSSRKLWMGSAIGLLRVDLDKRRDDGTFEFSYTRHRLGDADSTGITRPTSFYEDDDHSMWIGTNGHGLYRYTSDNGREEYINYTTAEGLASNNVKGVTGDRYGNIWVATVNGLSRLYPEGGRFTNYSVSDGLPDNQFYWNSATACRDGRLLLGTVCGLAEVFPEDADSVASQTSFPLAFTRLWVDNEPVAGGGSRFSERDVAYADGIVMHERDKSLQVEFAALDYDPAGDHLYCYRLVGFDDDWIVLTPGRRWASYTNLAPGRYTLLVKCIPDGIDAGEIMAQMSVVVKPYFYKSTWFVLLCVVVLCVVVTLLYKLRLRGLKQQQMFLREEVQKSTAALAEQKQLVERRANELAQRNDELTASNEEISRQKTRLTEMNRQIQEMTVDRLSFFTNITHEFRTPITLIIGPIERALKLSTNPKVIEQLHYVERNSKYLLTLVNQLMDFRKIEAGKLEISRTVGDFERFVNEVVMPFEPAAADRDITIRRVIRLPRRRFAFDEESLRKVLVNLLSNAIKFTPDGGTVTLYATAFRNRDGGPDNAATLYLSVSDTGSGIADEDMGRVFDRFYQADHQLKYPMSGAGDSGIGLYLCNSIVELYGGHITVKNNHGPGCTFRVTLPIPETDVQKPAEPQEQVAKPSGTPTGDSIAVTRMTVMVVEDNDDMRRFISSILRDRYTVIEARDGAEALNMLNDTQVDFIVSDLMMPVMDGAELSRCVKENFATSHIPFLMLTAKTSNESRIDSYRTGVDDYLLKPFDEDVLLARIEGILASRRRLQAKFGANMDTGVLEIAEESRDKKFTDQVMSVVRDNYRNSYFEVGDFAEALGISRSLLNKKLQNLMGQSAGQLMRNYRLNEARRLILKNRLTRTMNISEIAYEVGFNDSKYFTRCFTRQFGVAPSAMMNDDT